MSKCDIFPLKLDAALITPLLKQTYISSSIALIQKILSNIPPESPGVEKSLEIENEGIREKVA